MDLAQSVLRRDQAEVAAHHGGYRVGELGRKILQHAVDDAPKPARSEATLPSRFIDRDNPADLQRGGCLLFSCFGLVGGVAKNFKLGLHQLQFSTALLFDLAIKRDELSGLEAVSKIGAVEPDTLQPASTLPGGHLEDRHAAGAEQARGADLGDDCRHLSHAQLGNSAGVHAIFVAEGQIMKQIVDSVDALGTQHLGQARADALNVLHRGGQLEHLSDVSRIGK